MKATRDYFTKTIDVGFEITDPQTIAVFDDDVARTFYLLWRIGHLVSDEFVELCIPIGRAIREAVANIEDVDPADIVQAISRRIQWAMDVGRTDTLRFFTEYAVYFIPAGVSRKSELEYSHVVKWRRKR